MAVTGSCIKSNNQSSDTSFTEVTACESYEWNGETYNESGTYEYSEQNNIEYSMSFDGIDDEIILNDIIINNSFSFETYVFIPQLILAGLMQEGIYFQLAQIIQPGFHLRLEFQI